MTHIWTYDEDGNYVEMVWGEKAKAFVVPKAKPKS